MLNPRTKPTPLISNINVAAFAAVMFVLLFLLMFASPFAMYPHHGGGVDIPRVSHPAAMRSANREDAVILTITRDDRFFLGSDQMGAENLAGRIRGATENGAERKIYIRADAHCRYATVKRALDAVRDAGIENVAFFADKGAVQR
jgi:biopolymer transport protein TolR